MYHQSFCISRALGGGGVTGVFIFANRNKHSVVSPAFRGKENHLYRRCLPPISEAVHIYVGDRWHLEIGVMMD